MKVLALDIGSSSAKAAVVVDGAIVGEVSRVEFQTAFTGSRAEVSADVLLNAGVRAVRQLDAEQVDAIALASMSPAWLALDEAGRPITPVVTHADRRSTTQARGIEAALGAARYADQLGNRPVPGGISATTCKWFVDQGLLDRAATVGHLPTYLHAAWTGARVMDTSNAGFTGLWNIDENAWDEHACREVGIDVGMLPKVVEASALPGKLHVEAASELGLPEGTPMSAGIVDGSGAMIVAGARIGQLVNAAGSTDVLAVCLDCPEPRADLLTRPLGIDGKWVSVATEAAAGSCIDWARRELFADYDDDAFAASLSEAVNRPRPTDIAFDPRLAGSRTDIDQPTGAMTGLTLGTTRHDMLHAILNALAASRRQRLAKLEALGTPLREDVVVTGGGANVSGWPSRFRLRVEEEATLRGAALALTQ